MNGIADVPPGAGNRNRSRSCGIFDPGWIESPQAGSQPFILHFNGVGAICGPNFAITMGGYCQFGAHGIDPGA